jgi:hypothetical protein
VWHQKRDNHDSEQGGKCTKELLVYYTCDSVQKMGSLKEHSHWFMLNNRLPINYKKYHWQRVHHVRAVDEIVIVDIKSFNSKRIAYFFNEFVNDALIIVNHAKATYLDFFVLWIVVCKKALDFFVYYFYLP